MVIGSDTDFTKNVAESNGWHVEVVKNFDYFSGVEKYGSDDCRSGVFPDLLKRCVSGDLSKKEGIKMIVLQGSINAIWVENLNTVLDGNKVLTLAWGE